MYRAELEEIQAAHGGEVTDFSPIWPPHGVQWTPDRAETTQAHLH
jgi:hypothetical protein